MNVASTRSHRVRLLRDLLIMMLLIGATAWLSLSLARVPGGLAVVWISNGIWAGWLLSRRTALWPGYLVAGYVPMLAARLVAGDGWFSSVALSAFSLLEVLIICAVVRRAVPDISNPRRWLGLGSVATGSTLVACATSGVLASALKTIVDQAPFLPTFMFWWSTHVVGMVVVGTLTLVVHRKGTGVIDVPGKRWDFLGCIALIAIVSGAVFYQSAYPLLFLAYPPLLFAVYRHRFAGVVVGISVMGIIGSIATALGYGPLALVRQSDVLQRMVLLQLFIGAACVMAFPLALSMAERKRLMRRVRDSEMRYRILADYSHDVVVRMRADEQRLYVSPSAHEILGWEPSELLQSGESLVHPDDRQIQQQTIAAVLASGQWTTAIYRMRHKQGHYVWMEVAARPIPGEEKNATDIILTGRNISVRVAAEQALQASRQELETQARLDGLTGLANRRQFDEQLAMALGRWKRHGSAVALMYMDIDYFKQVNDRFGHAAGDEVLRVFGQRLQACVRSGDLVARLGGDEFVVLIEDLSSTATAEAIAEKLIAAMGEGIAVEERVLHVTTSIGIAYSANPALSKVLTGAADAALYQAKEAGRNTYQLVMTGGD